jgi:hypothetical protein
MKNLKIASFVVTLPLLLVQLTFAQDSSDGNVAIDGSREVIESQTGLPLSAQSAVKMGFEQGTNVPASIPSAINNVVENVGETAGWSEATVESITGPVGAFLAASGESSTAGSDLDYPNPYYVPGGDNGTANDYLQQLQAQQDTQSQFDRIYMQSSQNQLKNAATAPTGPSISPSYSYGRVAK